ncbi:hypothetical protein HYY75_02445 [bacterium]|nr:hypothetical protein [bacterium]
MKRLMSAMLFGLFFLTFFGHSVVMGVPPTPTNGVAYVLLPKDTALQTPGVYRLNSFSARTLWPSYSRR